MLTRKVRDYNGGEEWETVADDGTTVVGRWWQPTDVGAESRIRALLIEARANNSTFLAAATPGTAATAAAAAYSQARALTRQMQGVIRLLGGLVDTDDLS